MSCVTRAAPFGRPLSRTGAAVASSFVPSVAEKRSTWLARPRSAAAISGRDAYDAPIVACDPESATTRPVRSTITTRPRVFSATVAASARSGAVRLCSSPSLADAATTCACERACELTSLSIRSRVLSASGTTSATIARSRT